MNEIILNLFNEKKYADLIVLCENNSLNLPLEDNKSIELTAKIIMLLDDYKKGALDLYEKSYKKGTGKHMLRYFFFDNSYNDNQIHLDYFNNQKQLCDDLNVIIEQTNSELRNYLANYIVEKLLEPVDDEHSFIEINLCADDIFVKGFIKYVSQEKIEELNNTYASKKNKKKLLPTQLELANEINNLYNTKLK